MTLIEFVLIGAAWFIIILIAWDSVFPADRRG